jgi:Fe-S-cluster-containing dehydrogenase component
MKKWNMVIDVARCHDCNDCFLADKDEFVGNDFPPFSVAQPWSGHRWMNIERKERGQHPIVQVAFLPTPCMHCADAPCIEGSPEGTVYRQDNGLVIIDPVEARGHDEIVDTCPYGAIYWNEEKQLPQKCTGCAHLIKEGWTETRCSQVCPTDAIKLHLIEDAEMAEMAEREGLEPLHPEWGTRPRVYYKNLYRWNKAFVSASLAYKDTDECAEGAQVTVFANGSKVGEGTSNNYGEFIVDKLDPGADYEVAIEAAGYMPYTTRVRLDKSVNLGLIALERA